MAAIKPEEKITKQEQRLKLPADVIEQTYAYAKYLSDSSVDYVVSEALRSVIKADGKFQAWLGQHPDAGKQALTEAGKGRSKRATAGPVAVPA